MKKQPIRNVAIIAHVDHGKTTLVDQILRQSNFFREGMEVRDCFLDSNDLERERGITILSKHICMHYKGVKINLIDTPGHSDFGGQVERVLNLADGVLLLVDAAEGPMPQTRFVLDKALQLGLKPIVLVNKVDKPMARPDAVHDEIFDLFVELKAHDEQLDFPMLYASGRDGWACTDLEKGPCNSILPVLDAILEHIPPPPFHAGPAQLQVTTLDYNDYVGRIGIGRVHRGTLDTTTPMVCIKQCDGSIRPVRLKQLFTFEGLERRAIAQVACGDLCAVVGIEDIDIGDTIAEAEHPEPLPPITVDEPTISMLFRVNNSPFFGKESTFATSRHLQARLLKEQEKDVALQVGEISGDCWKISGRGVLHLSILIENMRREGYEMTVSQPHVIFHRDERGRKLEPIEILTVDTPAESSGRVIEAVGLRKGEMVHMEPRGERNLIEFHIPTRGIIGLRTKLNNATAGEAIISHRFFAYRPFRGAITHRVNGVLISMGQGKALAYAIDGLQLRGTFFIAPGEVTYEGMIVAEHCKEGDLVVNLQKGKQLTNVRAAGSDRNVKIAPPRRLSLEECLEFIAADELLEVTPLNIRMRKRELTVNERKQRARAQPAD